MSKGNPIGTGQLAERGCKMCEDRKRLVQFGPRSWTLDTYSDTGGCCSRSGTNCRRRETRRRLSCLLRAGQKATVWKAPAPILKRSFKSTCIRPTGHSSRRLRMRLRGSGRGHSASVTPASDRSPRLVWKLYLGRTSVSTVRRSNGPDSLSENHGYQLPISGLIGKWSVPRRCKKPHSDKTTSQDLALPRANPHVPYALYLRLTLRVWSEGGTIDGGHHNSHFR